jgi:ribosomal protein L21E
MTHCTAWLTSRTDLTPRKGTYQMVRLSQKYDTQAAVFVQVGSATYTLMPTSGFAGRE